MLLLNNNFFQNITIINLCPTKFVLLHSDDQRVNFEPHNHECAQTYSGGAKSRWVEKKPIGQPLFGQE